MPASLEEPTRLGQHTVRLAVASRPRHYAALAHTLAFHWTLFFDKSACVSLDLARSLSVTIHELRRWLARSPYWPPVKAPWRLPHTLTPTRHDFRA